MIPKTPFKIPDTAAFRDIQVNDYSLVYNRDNKPVYHNCNYCNNIALYVLTRTSNLTDKVYNNFICDHCLEKQIKSINL